jgi:hypothetical protein
LGATRATVGVYGRLEANVRGAFVLRISPRSDFENGKIEGRVEEVDTGQEGKFRSVQELIAFLSKCLPRSKPNTTNQESPD